MKNRLLFFLAIGSLVALDACDPPRSNPSEPIPFDGTAYRPTYASAEAIAKIETLPPRALRQPGKIYILGNYLFVNEMGEGVHIIDNSDPTAPRKISFVKIPGNHDMAAKGRFLYADNARDLVVFDLGDPTSVELVKRVEKALPARRLSAFPKHLLRVRRYQERCRGELGKGTCGQPA